MFKNIPIIFILIHLTDNKSVALIYSVTIYNKKGIVLGQGAPDVMSFLLLPIIFRFTSGSSVHFKVNFIQQRCPLNTELATLLYINKTYIKNIKKKNKQKTERLLHAAVHLLIAIICALIFFISATFSSFSLVSASAL